MSSEIFGNDRNVRMIFGLLSDNFGADFVSFWMKFTVTVNFLLLVLKCLKFREMVKTIVLGQDPPLCKKTGGLFMYPPSPTLKDGVLFV